MMMFLRLGSEMLPVLLLLSAAAADAANLTGWPRIGRPAITVPGAQFGVGDKSGGTVFLLSGETRISVPVMRDEEGLSGGAGLATLPVSVPPGRYALAVPTSTGESVRSSAVHVLASIPSRYSIALVRSDIEAGGEGSAFSAALLERIAGASPDLVFVLGRLTPDGRAASYTALTRQFSALSAPVVFCPDQDELLRGEYRKLFGEPVYPLRYGEDGFLVLGADMGAKNSGTEARLGSLYRWRRAFRACRWSTGVTGRFGLDWAMRSQLTLFVDDPLDYLIAGETSAGFAEKVPWGRTRFAIKPALPVGPLQLLQVDEFGMRLRESPGDGGGE